MEIPTAYCELCKEIQPILWAEDPTVIGCIGCKQILNNEKDIEVTWYESNDLEKVSKWKFVEKDGESVGGLYKQD